MVRKKWYKILCIGMLIILMVGIVGCGQQKSSSAGNNNENEADSKTFDVTLDFVAAPTDGDWYPIAAGLWDLWQKNIPGLKVNILPGGGNGNVIAVGNGQSGLGMASSTDVVGGYKGVIPFSADQQFPKLRMLFSLAPSAQYCVAYKDSGIKTFEDIKGKRVNVKPKGYSSNALNMIVLEAAGISVDDFKNVEYVGDDEAIELMQDGHLDVMMSGGEVPASSFIELSLNKPIEIIPYDEKIIDEVQKLNPGLFKLTIPKGIYNGVDADVPALGYTLCVFVNADLPDDLVYEMTKTVCENITSLYDSIAALRNVEPQDLAKDLGIPYHPGAEKYFKEQGWR